MGAEHSADGPARAVTVPTRTPPRWVNGALKLVLRTPGVEGWLGRSVALITWTGRRSGRRYTTPVTYHRDDGEVTVLSRRSRSWWRNFAERPEIELRLAGETVRGRARASVGEEAALPRLIGFLKHNPRDAKAYGLRIDPDGRLDERDARALLAQVVVIEIELD
jgi:deazaflavin-dependent oxidoreductase (nitroreductase family)